MPRKKRVLSQNGIYHVYNRGVNKQDIVFDDLDRKTFFKFVAESVKDPGFELFAYSLMDNHFHLLVKTPTVPLDRIMRLIVAKFVRCVNSRHGRLGPLFQGRYQSRIVDTDAYLLSVIRYIHLNPVKAGMVKNLSDHAWTSFGSYTGKNPAWPWLNQNWVFGLFDTDRTRALKAFINFHHLEELDSSIDWPHI